MTSGSSMPAMIRIAPPQAGQVPMSIPNTRLRRCAQVIVARVIGTSVIGEFLCGEWCDPAVRLWPILLKNTPTGSTLKP